MDGANARRGERQEAEEATPALIVVIGRQLENDRRFLPLTQQHTGREVNGERRRIVIRMAAFVRMRQDHVGLKLVEEVGNFVAELHEVPCRLSVDESKRANALRWKADHAKRGDDLGASRLCIRVAILIPSAQGILIVERGAVGDVNDRYVGETAQNGAGPDCFIVRMRDDDNDASRSVGCLHRAETIENSRDDFGCRLQALVALTAHPYSRRLHRLGKRLSRRAARVAGSGNARPWLAARVERAQRSPPAGSQSFAGLHRRALTLGLAGLMFIEHRPISMQKQRHRGDAAHANPASVRRYRPSGKRPSILKYTALSPALGNFTPAPSPTMEPLALCSSRSAPGCHAE